MIRFPCWFNNSAEFEQTGKVLVISCLFTADRLNVDVPINPHKVAVLVSCFIVCPCNMINIYLL